MSVPTNKRRFILQHVWKTGGSEFCLLVRANGWTTPPTHNCYHFIDQGWPIEDYDMIANERVMMVDDGKIRVNYLNVTKSTEMAVRDVTWITILRHPYSRSLSHYSHMLALNKTKDFTLPEFLTHSSTHSNDYEFSSFIPNQQTKWHCGTWECGVPDLKQEHLVEAMSILDQFHVILILEDMKDPNSCTRLQMRHVLNLTKVEVLADLKKKNASEELENRLYRRPLTNWYKETVPHLGPLVYEGDNSTWDELSSHVMAALGLQNDMDLQLYGYARKLCKERGLAIQAMLRQQQDQDPEKSTSRNGFAMIAENVNASFPSVPMSLQVSSLVILSLWILMLPSIRRQRIGLLIRKWFSATAKHDKK